MDENNLMLRFRTFTGMTMLDAVRKFGEILPPDAYKAIEGTALDLTDIDPAYLTQVATQVFGLCGLGWTFEYDPSQIQVVKEVRKKKDGSDRTVYSAAIFSLKLSYAVVAENGEVHWSHPVLGTGGSDNDSPAFAVRGALTNAIGAAFAKLCWQLLVYQGKVTHRNAATLYAKRNPEKADTKDPGPANAPTLKTPEPSEPPSIPAEESVPELTAPISSDPIAWAKSQVIPEGLAFAGQNLGDALADTTLGQYVIKWLTGNHANAGGEIFQPKDAAGEDLKRAAILLYDLMPKGKAKK